MNIFENIESADATLTDTPTSTNLQDSATPSPGIDLSKMTPDTATLHLPELEIENSSNTLALVSDRSNAYNPWFSDRMINDHIQLAEGCRRFVDHWAMPFLNSAGLYRGNEARWRQQLNDSENYLRTAFRDHRDQLSNGTLSDMANYFRTSGSEHVQAGTENRHIPAMVRDANMQTALEIERYLRSRR
ncbi:MAG: hypothetical protein K2W95_05835 [Candidatus Obscuribacterales bacterium]|nr:hypothetical protein [Candidatus Obscuribacterales bacterium]